MQPVPFDLLSRDELSLFVGSRVGVKARITPFEGSGKLVSDLRLNSGRWRGARSSPTRGCPCYPNSQMEIPFRERLAARAKTSRTFAVVLVILGIAWEAVQHQFYSSLDELIVKAIHPSFPVIATAAQWALAHPLWLLALLGGCYCSALVVWALLPSPRAQVEIVSLRQNDPVDYRQVVYGIVKNVRTPFQLFVYSPDNIWYPQWDPQINGHNWRAQCQFGNVSSPSGGAYTIVAISGEGRVQSGVRELPKGIRSEPIKVWRSATPAVQSESGIYFGRRRLSLKASEWTSYTPNAGTVMEADNSIRFCGKLENGFRYPREDTDLTPAGILGFRFQAEGDVNFYAHFRSTTLYFNTRFADWGSPSGESEFRVPLPAKVLNKDWHIVFIFLSCIEQLTGKRIDVLQRFSVRGNLTVSHLWCLNNLDELPANYLGGAIMLNPPMTQA